MAIRKRRKGRTAGAALRFCLGLWLVAQIVYAPIHLCRVSHSDDADFSAATPPVSAAAFVGPPAHEHDGNHERHPAAQHKFKGLRSARVAPLDLLLVPAVAWMDAEKDCPQPRVFEFSGLSPPELPRCWQFFFRAALPVRAPAVLS